MNAFLNGIGKLFGKAADQIQGRVERLKNEKATLEKELAELKKKDSTILNAYKAEKITARINEINTILGNNAKD